VSDAKPLQACLTVALDALLAPPPPPRAERESKRPRRATPAQTAAATTPQLRCPRCGEETGASLRLLEEPEDTQLAAEVLLWMRGAAGGPSVLDQTVATPLVAAVYTPRVPPAHPPRSDAPRQSGGPVVEGDTVWVRERSGLANSLRPALVLEILDGGERLRLALFVYGTETLLRRHASPVEVFLTRDERVVSAPSELCDPGGATLQHVAWHPGRAAARSATAASLRRLEEHYAAPPGTPVAFIWRYLYHCAGDRFLHVHATGACCCPEDEPQLAPLPYAALPGGGFSANGRSYAVGDHVFLEPLHCGLPATAPYVVARLLAAAGSAEEPVLRWHRLFRPMDVPSVDAAREPDWHIYDSAALLLTDPAAVVRACSVLPWTSTPPADIFGDTFICTGEVVLSAAGEPMLQPPYNFQAAAPAPPPPPPPPRREEAPRRSLALFCGGGGGDRGMEDSGYSTLAHAVELDHAACATVEANFPEAEVHWVDANVWLLACWLHAGLPEEEVQASPEAWEAARDYLAKNRPRLPLPGELYLLLGGPPCQGELPILAIPRPSPPRQASRA